MTARSAISAAAPRAGGQDIAHLEMLRAAAETCPHGVAIKRRGRILFANSGYARLLGYDSAEAILGKVVRALRGPVKTAVAGQNGKAHLRPELEAMEFRFRHTAGPLRLEVLRDVSERRRLERQLRVAQKMDALGRVIGGVAHDFNNLLTAVMLYCDLLRQELPEGNARRHEEEINLAAQRGAALVRQLLAFARQQVLEPQVLSLNTVLLGMRDLLQRLIGDHIELVTCCFPGLRLVKVDPAQLQQVILNLVVNARDAMPAGGRLTLETMNVTVDAAARRNHGLRPGPYVRLRVADTGWGMSADTLAHAFEPFFTTKAKGKGTGLGLSMVYGIVTQSGGAVSLESVEGRGSRVTILLPCAARGARRTERKETGPAAAETKPVRQGSATVLLVEDDPAVCDSEAQLLEQAGYVVMKARSGAEALRRAAEHGGPLDVLICDLVLPGVSGREVARRVLAQRPDTAVVYTSGYRKRAQNAAAAKSGALILPKPFTRTMLARTVRQALAMRSTQAACHRGGMDRR